MVRDGFISAAERDIYTGDEVVVNIITKDGVQVERFPLRRDWSDIISLWTLFQKEITANKSTIQLITLKSYKLTFQYDNSV